MNELKIGQITISMSSIKIIKAKVNPSLIYIIEFESYKHKINYRFYLIKYVRLSRLESTLIILPVVFDIVIVSKAISGS